MVKGVSRQVIVVRSPDTKLFEQAIFLLREDAPEVTDAQVLRQACQVADGCIRTRNAKTPPRGHWRGAACMLLGALFTGLAWALNALLH